MTPHEFISLHSTEIGFKRKTNAARHFVRNYFLLFCNNLLFPLQNKLAIIQQPYIDVFFCFRKSIMNQLKSDRTHKRWLNIYLNVSFLLIL